MRIKANLYSYIDTKEKHIKYFYRVTENEYEKSKIYGIEVERQDYIDNKIANIEREYIKLVSYDETKANKLLNILYKNKVSPIHLYDIYSIYEEEYV